MYRFPFLILFYNILLWSDTATEGQAYEYFFKAEYALLKNNYLQAELDFSKALLLSPDSPTILHSLVDLKSYQGQYADAIKYLLSVASPAIWAPNPAYFAIIAKFAQFIIF